MQARNWLLILFLILVSYALSIWIGGLAVGPVFDGLTSGELKNTDVTFRFEHGVWMFLLAAVAFAVAVAAIVLTARLLKNDRIRRVPGYALIFFSVLAGFNAMGSAIITLTFGTFRIR